MILIHDELPDLVVTDMMMPMMDGRELIRHLRAEPRTAGVRILAVTANPNAREAASLADGVLGKPFDRSVLLAIADSLVGKGIHD